MTDPEKKDEDYSGLNFGDVIRFQNEKAGKLLDFNQQVVRACRQQALRWQEISQAYLHCADEAQLIAESCAIAARISSDRCGDLLSNEFNLSVMEEEEEDNDDSDEQNRD